MDMSLFSIMFQPFQQHMAHAVDNNAFFISGMRPQLEHDLEGIHQVFSIHVSHKVSLVFDFLT